MRRIHCLVAVAVALSCCVIPLFAGQNLAIIEGADPVGSNLQVLVGNSAVEAQSGTVYANVILANGKTASQMLQVVVDGGGKQIATFQFDNLVREVVAVGIVEGPDPIPQ